MKLFYKKIGSGQPLIILHGLMGMLDNWQGPAKEFSKHFECYIIDQRNHGHSPHSDTFNYEVMADDLLEFIEFHELNDVHILGHSMGGKTAMKFAQNHPDYIKKLIIADISPRGYKVHHQLILEGLSAINLEEITRRSDAGKVLQKYIPESGVRQFLLKNLYWVEKGKLAWRFNLDAIINNIEVIGEEINDQLYLGETLFLKGENSNYIEKQDIELIDIYFPNSTIKTIKNAGHWLHAEQPAQFLTEVIHFLNA